MKLHYNPYHDIGEDIEEFMSTRSSIWLGESEGKSVHIYWELADREKVSPSTSTGSSLIGR
jgi:hypothetical protein